jgi:hypothetical protein
LSHGRLSRNEQKAGGRGHLPGVLQ